MRPGLTLYFVRHGETDWNAERRYQGQTDIPLNDRGRAQSRRNGEALRAFLPHIAGADFVASPLGRARETMEILRDTLGLDPSGLPARPPPHRTLLRRLGRPASGQPAATAIPKVLQTASRTPSGGGRWVAKATPTY